MDRYAVLVFQRPELSELSAHATQPAFAYVHRRRMWDLVISDTTAR